MTRRWSQAASLVATGLGSPWAFATALALVLSWAATGPIFGFAPTWQLVINTGTTIITFLAVFLIQHAQNRDTKALHVKLDALLEALSEAPEGFSGIEDRDEEAIKSRQSELQRPGSLPD